MSECLIKGLHIFVVAIEFFVFIILSSSFFRFRQPTAKIIGVCLAVFGVNYGALICFGHHVSIKLIWGVIVFTLLSQYLYAVSIARSFFLAIAFLSIINIGDNVLLFSISALSNQSMTELIADPYVYYLQAFFSKLIEIVGVSLIHAWGKHRFYKRKSCMWNYLRFSAFPTISLICSITLLNTFVEYPQATPQLLLCTIALLVSDIVIIILLDQFEAQQQSILDNQLLRRELELAHNNIVSLSTSYSNERKLTHDFQNKLAVIQGLLQEDQAGERTMDYINQLLNQEYVSSLAVSTHRTVADVLLNQKYIVATQKQIKFRVQLDDLSHFPLSDDALVVVLSNLVDNAIEACEKIRDPSSRYILIKAQVSNDESILYVENSVDIPVKIVDGHIATTKDDAFQHGYGLQNVLSIIKSHNGIYAMQCEELRFSFVVCFSDSGYQNDIGIRP